MHSSRLSPWVLAGLTVLITLLAAGCSQGQRQLPAFSNPVVPGLWTPDRMAEAESIDNPVANDLGEDAGISDPEPRAVPATSEKTPYRDNAAVIGKLFFDTPDGPGVCSGSAVADPARPSASSLVWTAGHCVHAGANGTWFRNMVFVPSYNDGALEGSARGNASQGQVAPFGTWWADYAETSPQWIEQGGPSGGDGAAFDFAVLHVRPPDSSGATSLQETIGQAAPVWFDAPSATQIPAIKAWGYPAASPFDGERMFSCQDRPGRLSVNADQPTLYRIGCTMTGGSSGGGWFAQNTDGALALVSNTSIGPADNTWLAGPRLGAEAKRVYGSVSDRFSSARQRNGSTVVSRSRVLRTPQEPPVAGADRFGTSAAA